LQTSAKLHDEVRCLDLADRFLNTQYVRAVFRADDVQSGAEKAMLFSKEPDSIESANLHDMQSIWYESAMARSYHRQHNYGKALKNHNETFKHFTDIAEDQFDFHNYCLRKSTLKTYVSMLRMQDRLFAHKFYRRAAKDSIKIYLELHDKKIRGEALVSATTEGTMEKVELSTSEKRKMKQKMKREAEKVKKKEGAASSGKPKKVDDDPEGLKLLEKDHIEEACRLVRTLMNSCSLDMATHILSYEVCSRMGKWLQCLRALVQLWKIGGNDLMHYKLIGPLSHFCYVADLDKDDMPKVVRRAIMFESARLFECDAFEDVRSLREAAEKTIDVVEARLRNGFQMPLAEILASLKCLKNAGRDCKGILQAWSHQGPASLKEWIKLMNYIATEWGKEPTIWERFRAQSLELFPLLPVDKWDKVIAK